MGRLEGIQPAIGCRLKQRARRLRAQGKGEKARGHARSRAGTGAARRPLQVMGITRRPRVHIGKFSGMGFTHDHRPGLTQQRNHMGIPRGPVVGVDRRVKCSRMVAGINDVLDPHRHTGQ